MGSRSDSDIDDDFRELYEQYTGPPGSTTVNSQDNAKAKKRPHAGSDEEKEPCDPNAVPTDFTSREAKVWEAKSKATERNWKKKKEVEMICKICGDPGHFTQGCPSTLGANRKSQDFFERVPARDSHVRAIFMGKAMQKIEKDIGCKLRLEENFLIVSGKDRLILAKGVDAVHKMIKDGGDQKGLSGTCKLRSRPPIRSLVGEKFRSSDSQRSNRCPPNASEYHPKFNKQEKGVENHIREDVQRFTKISPPQGSSFGEAYGTDRSRSCSRCSKSPARPLNKGNLYNSYNSRSQSISVQRSDGERRAPGAQSHMLEELEMDYKREVMDLERIRDKEEDEENYRHREAIREIRENYMQKLSIVRSSHARQFEEFVKLDSVRRQLQACEQMSGRGFGGYKQQSFSNYDGAPNLQYAIPMDPRNVPLNPMENYPSRPNGSHGEFQCQTRDGHGKNYGQYKT